jgi:hypothetical protein
MKKAILFQCQQRIVGAARLMPTRISNPIGCPSLIELDKDDTQIDQAALDHLLVELLISECGLDD